MTMKDYKITLIMSLSLLLGSKTRQNLYAYFILVWVVSVTHSGLNVKQWRT